jgi:hypothetical protein
MERSGIYAADFWRLLTELARGRIRSGLISERGLARQAGLSQPHLHNVLKGIRELSPQSADRLMRALDVTVPQVLWSEGGVDVAEIRPVPLLRERIGPGGAASLMDFAGYMPFPARTIAQIVDPVVAWLSEDVVLPAEFHPGDLILMDRDPEKRIVPAESRCWVVAEPAGLRVRCVRRIRDRIEIGNDREWRAPGIFRAVSLEGRNILDIVMARIIWIGRELETPTEGQAGPPRPRD